MSFPLYSAEFNAVFLLLVSSGTNLPTILKHRILYVVARFLFNGISHKVNNRKISLALTALGHKNWLFCR